MKKLREQVSLVVIVPVGPKTSMIFLNDTIDSVIHFCGEKTKFILMNDSQQDISENFTNKNITVLDIKENLGKKSGLFFSLSLGMKFALEHYMFDVLLRLDDDALVTGAHPEKDALTYFDSHKNVGMLGSYILAWNNEKRDFSYPRSVIEKETSFFWRCIYSVMGIRKGNYASVLEKAVDNGYMPGQHIQGGAYFMSYQNLFLLNKNHLLSSEHFKNSQLEEDFIFSMLTMSTGMLLADFVTGTYPMCIKWQGLPMHPNSIVKSHKKLVHSTRYFESMDEQEIRRIFRENRHKGRK